MAQAPQWTYDAARGRYRVRGRFASSQQVLALVDTYLATKRESVAADIFALLREGRITVKDAQLTGERQLAKSHLAAAMAAKGGRAQMSQADYGRVGARVKGELGHWRDRMKDVASGRALDGPLKASFRAFFAAPANTFLDFDEAEAGKRGFDEEANVLNDGAHHCQPRGGFPSCREITEHGWYKAGTMPRRGARACRWNCQCRTRRRNSKTGEVRE